MKSYSCMAMQQPPCSLLLVSGHMAPAMANTIEIIFKNGPKYFGLFLYLGLGCSKNCSFSDQF
jgi:hypothetical protein